MRFGLGYVRAALTLALARAGFDGAGV